jgi:hypothetical protein
VSGNRIGRGFQEFNRERLRADLQKVSDAELIKAGKGLALLCSLKQN